MLRMKSRWAGWGALAVLLLVGSVPGCGLGTAERVAWYEARAHEARGLIEAIDARLEPAAAELATLREQLAAIEQHHPGSAITKRMRQAVKRASKAIDAARSRRAQAMAALEQAEASIAALQRADADWGDELIAAGQVGQAVAPLTGPAAPWVALGSHVLALLGGLMIRRPGDVSGQRAKTEEHGAWDEADAQAFERGFRTGRAEGRWETLERRGSDAR